MLVLDSTSAAGLETVQSLGSRGCIVHAIPLNPDGPQRLSRLVSKQFSPGDFSTRDVGALIDLFRLEQYDLIVPATETALVTLLSAEIPDEMYDRAVLPSRDHLHTALNKQAIWNLASNLELCVPRSEIVTSASRAPEAFPVVLKPIFSKQVVSGAVRDCYVTIIRNVAEWNAAMTSTYGRMPIQQQEYISGAGVGVEMLFNRGSLQWAFIHKRIHELPLTGGGSSYRVSLGLQDTLINCATTLLSALDWHGVAMVEFKVRPSGEAFIMEVNPRLWGSLALAIDCGVDFPFGLFCIATGRHIPPQPQYRIGYFTRNIYRDIEWFKANLKADRSDPLLLTRPVLPSVFEWLRPWAGMESWDFFSWSDLGTIADEITHAVRHNWSSVGSVLRRRIRRLYLRYIQEPLTIKRIQRRDIRHLLFLCHGNICRSPLAAALAQILLPNVSVQSAGFYPQEGRQSPAFVLGAAATFGIDLRGHRSRRVNNRMIDEADLIVIMDLRNLDLLMNEFPYAIEKALLLGMMLPSRELEIHDPFDKPVNMVATATKIKDAIDQLSSLVLP